MTYEQLAAEVHFGEIAVASLKDALAGTINGDKDAEAVARAIATGEISVDEVEKIVTEETEYETYLEEMIRERRLAATLYY